jgi:hypothetical protein
VSALSHLQAAAAAIEASGSKAALKAAFTALMTADASTVRPVLLMFLWHFTNTQ